MFRISRDDMLGECDIIEGARETVDGYPVGRYHVDETRVDPFPSGHTSTAWDHLICRAAGRVEDASDSWPSTD
jgi:hypothetical protein